MKKIVMSAHFDLAEQVPYLFMDTQNLSGIVDNFAGVFCAYTASRKTGVPVYFTNFEEQPGYAGAVRVASGLAKDTTVIVVDTCLDVGQRDGYIGNVYDTDIAALHSQFEKEILFKDGLYEEDMDETYVYGQQFHLPCFFFGVPITGEYHSTDNNISVSQIDRTTDLLIRVLTAFQTT